MITSPTLFRYISLQFLKNIFILLLLLLSLVFILDTIELMRRAANQSGLSLPVVLSMAGLKLPEVGQRMIPFGILFGAIFTCWKLNKTNELVVIRSAGLSAWQFLSPMIFCAFLFGVMATTLLNPLSAAMIGKFEQMESIYLNRSDNLVTVSRTGIWLRQPADNGYSLFHAESFEQNDWRFSNIIVFFFDNADNFTKRIDSPVATLRDGYWELESATVSEDQETLHEDRINISTNLTSSKLEESFSNPDTVSFWKIPDYLRIMDETGFPTSSLQIHFQSLLAKPLMLVAMVLLAAAFSLRPPRFGGHGALIALGVAAGFFIFFMESMLHAFGISQKIPVYLAAWTPAVVSLLLGATAMLHLEDG